MSTYSKMRELMNDGSSIDHIQHNGNHKKRVPIMAPFVTHEIEESVGSGQFEVPVQLLCQCTNRFFILLEAYVRTS